MTSHSFSLYIGLYFYIHGISQLTWLSIFRTDFCFIIAYISANTILAYYIPILDYIHQLKNFKELILSEYTHDTRFHTTLPWIINMMSLPMLGLRRVKSINLFTLLPLRDKLLLFRIHLSISYGSLAISL